MKRLKFVEGCFHAALGRETEVVETTGLFDKLPGLKIWQPQAWLMSST